MRSNSLPVWALRAAFQVAKEWRPDRALPGEIAALKVVQLWLIELRSLRDSLRGLGDDDLVDVEVRPAGLVIRVPRESPDDVAVIHFLTSPVALQAFGEWLTTELGDREVLLRTGFESHHVREALSTIGGLAGEATVD